MEMPLLGLRDTTRQLFDLCSDVYLSEDHCWGADLDTIYNFTLRFNKPNILDIGCGTGWHLANTFFRTGSGLGVVAGLDYSTGMLNTAVRFFNNMRWDGIDLGSRIALIRADALAIPFQTKTFDIVLMLNNTLGNILGRTFNEAEDNRITVLRQVLVLLKPGGHLILTVYNADTLNHADTYGDHYELNRKASDLANRDLVRMHTKYGVEFYSHWFTVSEIKRTLSDTGYSLLELENRRKRIVAIAQHL